MRINVSKLTSNEAKVELQHERATTAKLSLKNKIQGWGSDWYKVKL